MNILHLAVARLRIVHPALGIFQQHLKFLSQIGHISAAEM